MSRVGIHIKTDYPEDIEERIKKNTDNYFLVDAVTIAEKLKNLKVANTFF
jgi:hypothetical protein